ncbi:MAG TPA: cytochrome c3 family protein [Steroidobacteraceae bacterium]|nr:cytochrome c3 family protein [Steroidobacteraceae bacterium]
MLICLIRGVAGNASAAQQQAPGTLFQTTELTIGSAPDQHLQVPHEDVDPHHAILRVTPNGRVLLTALGPKGVSVNGRRQTRVFLDSDDTLKLGETTVKVQRSRGEYACVLRIEDPFSSDETSPASAASTRNHSSRYTISFWSWTLTISVAAIFLLVPMGTFLAPSMRKLLRSTPLVPSDALWSSGPLHATHRFIGNDCTSCHVNPFQRVRNSECEKCHAEVQHHVDVRTADLALFDNERCAECHFEHKEPATLILRDPRLCTDCHARLDRLKSDVQVENAADFGSDHPELRLAVLKEDEIVAPGQWRPQWLESSNAAGFKETSHLKFSHAQHLNPKGIKSPLGERVLQCSDCHRPNSSGREMMPIRMETQCSGCHSLHFDEHDPTSGVPHGDLQRMYRALREHFSRQYLEAGTPARQNGGMRRPGQEARQMSLDEQRRARDWADTESLKLARELLEKRVCVDCHDVTRVLGVSGFEQWKVAPVRLTQNWMPRARFNHAAHITQPCTSCHNTAERSKHSSDILMPGIAKCRECHGGAGDTSKLSSDCVMCHRFHLPNRGRFDTQQPQARLPQ